MQRGGGGSTLGAFVVVVLLLFLLGIYMIMAVPTVDGTADQMDKEEIEDADLMGQFNFTLDVALVYVPTILGMGLIAYLYAVVSGKGSFRGGGPR
jgi:hypothetical protein